MSKQGTRGGRAGAGLAVRTLAVLGLSCTRVCAQDAPAHADPMNSPDTKATGSYAAWVAGPSPGRPSSAKVATLTSFYTLTGLGLLGAGALTYLHFDANDDKQRAAVTGACVDLTSSTCQRLLDARHDSSSYAGWAALSGAASATFLLAGLLTAHYWDNLQATAAVSPQAARLNLQLRF